MSRFGDGSGSGLVDYAFSHSHIKTVDGHTLAERNASTRVLEKVGMKQVGTAHDPDVGAVLALVFEESRLSEDLTSGNVN